MPCDRAPPTRAHNGHARKHPRPAPRPSQRLHRDTAIPPPSPPPPLRPRSDNVVRAGLTPKWKDVATLVELGMLYFENGAQTYPATVPAPYSGSSSVTGMVTMEGVPNASTPLAGVQQLLSFDNGLQLVQAANGIVTRGNNYANTLTGLLQTSSLKTVFPAGNPLAAQLQTVANVMSVRAQLDSPGRSSSATSAASIPTERSWRRSKRSCNN